MKIRITSKIESAIVAVLVFAAAIALRADTITVSNTNDSGPGSLRQALSDANDGDTITFAVAGTIGLTSGELLVNKSITISGPGADSLAVNGNAKSRVFHISSAKTVTISGLTITNGMTAGPYPNNYGGGIYNDHATLTATNCVIDDNFAEAGGAGIFNDGSFEGGSAAAEITNTTLRGNGTTSAGGAGGAIYNFGTAATLIINSSTISGNSAGTLGGGIYSDSLAVTVQNSTLSGNSVGDSIGDSGGGIVNFNATLTISNSTFSDNSAYLAGAIHNSAATLLMGNTVLKTGPLGVNIVNTGTGASQGYNLSSDDGGGYLTGPGDQINTDPLLGTLQNNGGPTLTHELLPGSPAIDTGNPSFTPPPFNDQRGPGFDRVVNGRLDIGSFEVQSGGPTPTPTPTPSVTPSATPTPTATPRSTPTPRPRPAPRPRPTPR